MTSSAATTIAPRIWRAPSSSQAYTRRRLLEAAIDEARVTRRLSLPRGCTKRELITGESVIATMPDTTTAAAECDRELEKQRTSQATLKTNRRINGGEGMVIAMIGPTSSRAPINAAWIRDLPMRTCRSTFSTTTMASSTTRPTERTIARMVK